MILPAGYGIMDEMDRDELGRLVVGHNLGLGKKRPGFKNSGTFVAGQTPWNLGLDKSDPRVAKYVNANLDRVDKICENCGGPFNVNRFREKIARFCSRKCKSQSLGRLWTHPNTPQKFKGTSQTKPWNDYVYLHKWVEKNLGKPKRCEICGRNNLSRYHWANKSGKYKRNLNDWVRLCAKCHSRFDGISWERGVLKS